MSKALLGKREKTWVGKFSVLCLSLCFCWILSGCVSLDKSDDAYLPPEASSENAEMHARTAIESRVTGIFVAPKLSSEATLHQWRNALRDMKEIGIDTVIIQYCYQCNPDYGNRAYFPYEELDTAVDNDAYPLRREQIGWILNAASELEMEVYLGLQIAEEEWFHRDMYQDVRWLHAQYRLSAQLAAALWDTFGETYRDCISGWYLPFEFDSDEEYHPFYQQITQVYYAPLTAELKSHSEYGNLNIMISPMMYRTDDIGAWEDAVKLILSGSRIDIFAPQDGIGYGTQTHESISAWYQATRRAADAVHSETGRNIELWANCENYARLQNPEESDPIERSRPMSIGKFIKSMDLAAPYVDKLVTFSIHRWDVSLLSGSEAELNRSYLEAYRRYYANGKKPMGIAEGYYVNISPAEPDASLVLNPYARGELTDGCFADSGEWNSYKGMKSSDQTPFTMEIRFDDPIRISQVVSNYFADPSAAIGLPKHLEYEYFIRSGEKREVLSYTQFYVDTFSNTEGDTRSIAVLATPTVVDGIRITVFPGDEWTFLDEIWVE